MTQYDENMIIKHRKMIMEMERPFMSSRIKEIFNDSSTKQEIAFRYYIHSQLDITQEQKERDLNIFLRDIFDIDYFNQKEEIKDFLIWKLKTRDQVKSFGELLLDQDLLNRVKKHDKRHEYFKIITEVMIDKKLI